MVSSPNCGRPWRYQTQEPVTTVRRRRPSPGMHNLRRPVVRTLPDEVGAWL